MMSTVSMSGHSQPGRKGIRKNQQNPLYSNDDEDEDDHDNVSVDEHPTTVTPPQDDRNAVIPEEEVAAAAAEVAANARSGRRDVSADQALMGATVHGNDDGVGVVEVVDESSELVGQAFLEFLSEYRQEVQYEDEDDNVQRGFIHPYTEQADQMAKNQLSRKSDDAQRGAGAYGFANTLFVNYEHVLVHDPELAHWIKSEFCRFEPALRKAVQTFVLDLHPELNDANDDDMETTYFLAVHNLSTTLSIRRLRTDLIGALCSVTGTVTRSSDVRPELLMATFRCNKCGLLASKIRQQYHYTRPTICRNPRCKNQSPLQFTLEIRQSEFADWQKLRVQENSDQIPPGSMPRSIDVILRNEMVERAKSGDKCVFVGSLVVLPDGSALARAGEAAQASKAAIRQGNNNNSNDAAAGGGGGIRGLAGLGVRELTYRTCFVASSVLPANSMTQASNNEQIVASFLFGKSTLENHEPTAEEVAMEFTEAQRQEIRAMRESPRLYEQLVDSIAPTTFGHREVKKGILLMLLGGVHKTTVDGIRLRGDINVCIVGDPSTSKSAFLKYVHSFLPSRTVYTSGKASSAAGLTAAVQRDQDTGEFCIEAGALMLADNGICCIDEFDKMDPTDQVAIHEAMEQQTISITKAGIQATLNARASILAAANPIHGRYDRTKTLKSNVAMSAPILSRFDLFFVVLDDCNPESDKQVAKHILQVHRCQDQATRVPFSKDLMRRYIRFARTLNPKITPESQRVMVDCYRKLRQGDMLGRSRAAYRITVRQLESMVRLSEAIARMYCANEIQPLYVREAFRLLRTSIIQVETSDVEVEDQGDDDNVDPETVVETEPTLTEGQEASGLETQFPGEYNGGLEDRTLPNVNPNQRDELARNEESPAKKPKKGKKVRISFEEYEAISNAIATHLRALETSLEEQEASSYKSWGDVLDWYLEEVEDDIGDSLERLEEMRKKVNLVIRRLINTDHILVTVGDAPKHKKDELKTLLAVHPNHEIS